MKKPKIIQILPWVHTVLGFGVDGTVYITGPDDHHWHTWQDCTFKDYPEEGDEVQKRN